MEADVAATAPDEPAEVRARRTFAEREGGEPEGVARAPGRVNIIGAHVDYNEGFVLPAAVDRDVAVAFRARTDRKVHALAADLEGEDRFRLDGDAEPVAGWPAYVRGVAFLLQGAGVAVPGADLVISGDVPAGAGLSSSAALELATATALLALAGEGLPPMELAALCRRAEVEFAGVRCGIMDQVAAALGKDGHALYLDCRSLDVRYIPIPSDARIVATDSGVRRGLQDSEFNRRTEECREAARRLGVRALRDVSPEDLDLGAAHLPEPLVRRARHAVHEIRRTRLAAEALERGDLATVGALMLESHASSRDDYETSTPELDALVHIARGVDGVYGSRLSGAGFGGCTVALVDAAAVPGFVRRVPRAYRAATGREAAVHVLRAAAGASVLAG